MPLGLQVVILLHQFEHKRDYKRFYLLPVTQQQISILLQRLQLEKYGHFSSDESCRGKLSVRESLKAVELEQTCDLLL